MAGVIMNNHIKNTRKTYDRFLAKVITEVLVQFKDEESCMDSVYQHMKQFLVYHYQVKRVGIGMVNLEGEEFEKALNKYGYEYTQIPSRY